MLCRVSVFAETNIFVMLDINLGQLRRVDFRSQERKFIFEILMDIITTYVSPRNL